MKTQVKDLCKKSAAASLLALLLFGPAAMGSKSKSGASADVVAHITLAGSDSVVIADREADRKHYLFINQPSQKAVTVVDITNAKKPVIVKTVTYADGAQSAGEIFGTNLLLLKAEKAGGPGAYDPSGVVAFGGPRDADTPQQFTGLTSFLADEDRGLAYFTNADGLWIVKAKHTPRQDANDKMDLNGIYG
jgi:hypothetical protein